MSTGVVVPYETLSGWIMTANRELAIAKKAQLDCTQLKVQLDNTQLKMVATTVATQEVTTLPLSLLLWSTYYIATL
jgi:hypothetical protein